MAAHANGLSVLLVDDDLGIRQALTHALMLEEFRVVSVANGRDALHQFEGQRIDVVLLDLNLGPESGWDTFHKLKEICPRLPVVIMTGYPERAFSGVDRAEAFMEKPLDLAILFRKLKELAEAAG